MYQNNIAINKKVFHTSKKFEVTGDIIVPDIKPDIVSIINTNANSYIYKEEVTTGKVRFDGNIDTYVIYLAENGETRSIQTSLNFSESIQETDVQENLKIKENVTIEKIEAKVLNERKISITANMKILAEAYEKVELEIPSNLETDKDTQIQKETLKIKSIVGANTVRTSIKEDVSAGENVQIAEILKTDVQITNIENKISYNKVLAKADSNVKIIYLTEDGKIGGMESKIPVMSFIDIDKVTDKHICSTSYNIRNMLFKTNVNNGSSNTVNCQIDFEVASEVYEAKTIDVIQDMYGIKNNIEFTKKEIEVELIAMAREETVNLTERIRLEDILNIYDLNLSPRVVSINKSGKMYNYECELEVDVYYEADNRNGMNVKNFTLPFMMKFEENENEIEFNISKKLYTIREENVDLDIQILAKQSNQNMKTISIIENIETKGQETSDDYKMFMYFVKQGDTIWKIAKRFRVSMQDIINLNKLENPDKINIGDILYIMR